MKQWVISCILYTLSILFFMSYLLQNPISSFPLSFHILVLTTNLSVFQACCKIDNIQYGRFWQKYALILFTYGIVLTFCNVHEMIIFFPLYLYEIFIASAILFTILKKWRYAKRVKYLSACILTLCSLFQIYCSISISMESFSFRLLYIDICFLLLYNFTFNILYQKSLQIAQSLKDEYLFVLAEHAVDIIFSYTFYPSPRFSFISPSVEKIIGYRQTDFYKNPKLYLELTHEQDREIILKAFSNEASSVNKNYIRWQRKDGEYLYLEFHNTPIFSDEKLIGIEGILRDITERKLAEQEMIDSKRSKQILLSYISHELKTPITYIVGYAEALQKNIFASEEERQNAVDLISSKAIFLQKLVEDLFLLSKMESNQFSFEFMQTKVFDLYLHLYETHRNDILNTKIQYVSTIDESLKDEKYEVLVDLKRIEQVFSNLLHNAIKHTPENGDICCKCILDAKKEHIIFKMIDSGEGIPKEEIPYIFNRFYRGKNAACKTKEGSGLGLSLSLQIIKAHKGSIEVRPNKDKGCTFQFTIPLYAGE